MTTTAHPVRSSKVRIAVAVGTLLLSVMSVFAVSSSTPAGAIEVGGNGRLAQVASVTYGETACTRGRISATARVTPDAGYAQGQWMSYRIYVANDRGYAQASTWSANQFAYNNNFYAQTLAHTTFTAQLSSRYWIWVQVARWSWDGSKWGWKVTGWVPSGYTSYSGTAVNECYT